MALGINTQAGNVMLPFPEKWTITKIAISKIGVTINTAKSNFLFKSKVSFVCSDVP